MKKSIIVLSLAVFFALVGCNNGTKTVENTNTEETQQTFDSPDALFEAITESINAKQDAQKSIDLVNRLVSDYPDYENNSAALFMLATFVYDDQMHDLDKARETYQRIVDNYPDTPFANDAAIAITQLGMTPEELVRMFEETENGELKTEN